MLLQITALIASLLVFSSFFMKTMVPLRLLGMAGNLAFIIYTIIAWRMGLFAKVYPIFILHAALLPLNAMRLRQMLILTKNVHEASHEEHIDFLIPFMKLESAAKGDVLFKKGDRAEKFYFVQKGRVSLKEFKKIVKPGSVFGEVGIFSKENIRSATAVCAQNCILFSISRQKALELYYQNPKFGFYLIRLLTSMVQKKN